MSNEERLKNARDALSKEILGIQLDEVDLEKVSAKLHEWLQELHKIKHDEIINVEPAPFFCLRETRVKSNGNMLSDHR